MNDVGVAFIGIVLIFATGFFVAAEFALVSSRRSLIETGARKGSRIDRLVLKAMDKQDTFVAAMQVWITFLTIMVGSVVEPTLSAKLEGLFPDAVPETVVKIIAILIVSYPLLVIGELVPKYLALRFPETIMRATIGFLEVVVKVTTPLNWLIEKSGLLLLKGMRVNVDDHSAGVTREELYYLIRAGQEGGGLHESQADFVTKTLKLDQLDAEDAMLHRLDIKWLDADTPPDKILEAVAAIPHSRFPLCRGDVDDVVGIVYLQDIVRNLGKPTFSLTELAREAVFVPESVTLNRLVEVMRDQKSQIVIVQDEYGGTQGLVTLEDVVEEIFGDLEDSLESERPSIERTSGHRLSVKADVRYDELLDFLEIENDNSAYTTEPLAAIVIDGLGRTAKVGDTFEAPVGRLRVEQMAKRRITRVGVYLRETQEEAE